MSRLLLGVSGGIAAYKALELVRLATGAGHAVRVIQTPASLRFVGSASFAALSGAPVLTSEFDEDPARGAYPGDPLPAHRPASHLALARAADAMLIAPASANTIAKLAHGLADNLLTSTALAIDCPLLIAPAMNERMYEHPATVANLAALRARGVRVIEPAAGRLATHGEWGVGRLAEPPELLLSLEAALAVERRWAGLRVLVTAGGTREPIDDVRFVGNRSSGRQGVALAEAAAARGAEVVLIAANVELANGEGVRRIDVGSAAELEAACIEEFEHADVLIMAAAVADFRPAQAHQGKLDKQAHARLALDLEPTSDILSSLAVRRRPGQTLVGFAAEHGDGGLERARAKLERKRLDAIVLNDVADATVGFESAHNEVSVLTAVGVTHHARAEKRVISELVLDAVDALRSAALQAQSS